MDWMSDGITDDRRKAMERQQVVQAKLEGVARQLAQSNDGIFFLRWLLRETGALQQEYPADDRAALWNAGRRSVGMQVFSLCAAVNCIDKVCSKLEDE